MSDPDQDYVADLSNVDEDSVPKEEKVVVNTGKLHRIQKKDPLKYDETPVGPAEGLKIVVFGN